MVIQKVFGGRTSVFALTCIAGAFFLERAINITGDAIFDSYNKGVSTHV